MPIETIDLTRQGAAFARQQRSDEESAGTHVAFCGIHKILLTEQQAKDIHRTLGESINDNTGDE